MLILSLLQDALDKSVVFSEEDNFTKSKATGLKWNNESNDQGDGNREATWTNSGIYSEVLKNPLGFTLFGCVTLAVLRKIGKIDIAILR